MENPSVWLIVAQTNLHVGNENMSSYGIIDKSIQRDALTGLPCINSSSLKGAINEYATQVAGLNDSNRISIFGMDKLKPNSATKKGSSIFFDANILVLPVQDDETLYKRITCKEVVEQFINKMKLFGISKTQEEIKNKLAELGFPFSYISQDAFKEYCNDENLPIIARNKLDNGESENLWYEQFLPQETILGTLIISNKLLESEIDQKLIQIGANATIGYGYCKFIKL